MKLDIRYIINFALIATLLITAYAAFNPAEQSAKTQDKERQSALPRLGQSLEMWAKKNDGVYPPKEGAPCSTDWLSCLSASGLLSKNPPETFDYKVSNDADVQNAVVFIELESRASLAKCVRELSSQDVFAVYSTADGRSGTVCGEPSPGTQTFTY